MSNGYLDIARLLAASGFREREISEFVDELMRSGPEIFLDEVIWLRKQKIDHLVEHRHQSQGRKSSVHSPNIGGSEIINKIERLLLIEANISKQAAIDILTEELHRRYPNIVVPAESRKGFASWLSRLTGFIPERELLSIVTELRNKYVHSAPSDWQLR